MTLDELRKSVVLITSKNPKISGFGTGFVIYKVGWKAYVLTCAHVLKAVCGTKEINVGDEVKIEMSDAMVIASDDERDLAVLTVDELPDSVALKCYGSDEKHGEKDSPFKTAGFQQVDQRHLFRPLDCTLGEQVAFVENKESDIQAWDLITVKEHYFLEPGYSGSPVIDKNDRVLGVVNTRNAREGGRIGTAISIAELENFWRRPPDSNQLYCSLLKLDYQKQESLLKKVITKKDKSVIAFAFLIQGEAEHGQKWLSHRLVKILKEHFKVFFPKRASCREIPYLLTRLGRSYSINGLWREISDRLRLQESDRTRIAKDFARCCQRDNVILIFEQLEWMPKAFLGELLRDFWFPLVVQIKDSLPQISPPVLFMFLIDEEGRIDWDEYFTDAETLDLKSKPHITIRSPKISKFSKDILNHWIEEEYINLHFDLTKGIDETAQEIIEKSNDGIPEQVLRQICELCGHDWDIESHEWLKR